MEHGHVGLPKERCPIEDIHELNSANLALLNSLQEVTVLIIYSCSTNERYACKELEGQLQEMQLQKRGAATTRIRVVTVDMKEADDVAGLPMFNQDPRVGEHRTITFDMKDMSGRRAEKQLQDLMTEVAPDAIIAHPDCTYWSNAGNGTYRRVKKERKRRIGERKSERRQTASGKTKKMISKTNMRQEPYAKAMQNRNLPGILAILNYPNTPQGRTCSVLLENPNGGLQKRITPADGGVPYERMPHERTYTRALVDRWIKRVGPIPAANHLLAKQTNYWSGGLVESIRAYPLINTNPDEPPRNKLGKIEEKKTRSLTLPNKKKSMSAEEKSRTPKPVALTTVLTVLLRHAHARQAQMGGWVQVWHDDAGAGNSDGVSKQELAQLVHKKMPTDNTKKHTALVIANERVRAIREGEFGNGKVTTNGFACGILREQDVGTGTVQIRLVTPSDWAQTPGGKLMLQTELIDPELLNLNSDAFDYLWNTTKFLEAPITLPEKIMLCLAAEYRAHESMCKGIQLDAGARYGDRRNAREILKEIAKCGGSDRTLWLYEEEEDEINGENDVASPCEITSYREGIDYGSEHLNVPAQFGYVNGNNMQSTISPKMLRRAIADQSKRRRSYSPY